MKTGRVQKTRHQDASPRRSIEISFASRPRPYTRGMGPELAPLDVVLCHDSDAFITGKMILPTQTITRELKLQLHYIVGWPDLRAASVAIPATTILEYVSPRTLEDFEYKASLQRDVMEQKQGRASVDAAQETIPGTTSLPQTAPDPLQAARGVKKRGRPSKKAHAPGEVAVASQPGATDITASLPVTTSSGPSLSTPRKSLRPTAVDMSTDDDIAMQDGEESDADDAIFGQLYGELYLAPSGQSEFDSETSTSARRAEHVTKRAGDLRKFAAVKKPTPATKYTHPITSGPSSAGSTARASGLTPAARTSGKSPLRTDSDIPSNAIAATLDVEAQGRKKEKTTENASREDFDWVSIDSVEDDKFVEKNSIAKRYFRVRRKGDWPPHQKISWVPEENLPNVAVAKYLQAKSNERERRPQG